MDNEAVLVFSYINNLMTLLMLVIGWKVFNLNDIKGWKAFIPFYNIYLMCHVLIKHGRRWWLIFIHYYNIYLLWQTLKTSQAQQLSHTDH